MKKIKMVGIALAILLLAVAGVAAKPTTVKTSGESAYANFHEVTPDGVTKDTYFSVWMINGVTAGYVSITTEQGGNYKNEYGLLNINRDIIDISGSKRLIGATIKIPTIQLGTDVCDPTTWECKYVPTGILNSIELRFSGVGAVQRGSYEYKLKDSGYSIKTGSDSLFRDAVAMAMIDGSSIGTTESASIGIFKTATMEKMK